MLNFSTKSKVSMGMVVTRAKPSFKSKIKDLYIKFKHAVGVK